MNWYEDWRKKSLQWLGVIPFGNIAPILTIKSKTMKTVNQITIINASAITIAFDDGSTVTLSVGDSVDTATIVPVEAEIAPVAEVAPEVAPAPAVAPDAPAPTDAPAV